MKKNILGLSALLCASVAAVAVTAQPVNPPVVSEELSANLAVKFVATANAAETSAHAAQGTDVAMTSQSGAAGDQGTGGPAVVGSGPSSQNAGVEDDIVAAIVIAIENDVKAQVAAGASVADISAGLTRGSNTPGLSKNVYAAFGRVIDELAQLLEAGTGATNPAGRGLTVPGAPGGAPAGAGYRAG